MEAGKCGEGERGGGRGERRGEVRKRKSGYQVISTPDHPDVY